MRKAILLSFLTVVVLLFSLPALAADTADSSMEPSVGMKILDVVLVRPPCVLLSTISTVAYLGAALPAHIIGVSDPLAKYMVEAPWRFTSSRPLGSFTIFNDGKPIVGEHYDGI